jgi:hypothetical protein
VLRTLEGHSDSVNGVAVTPDGQRALSTSDDLTLKLWDLKTGRALRTLEGHSGAVNDVAITPDGTCAVSASFDKTLKVWDLKSGRVLRTLEGHSASVRSVVVRRVGGQREAPVVERGARGGERRTAPGASRQRQPEQRSAIGVSEPHQTDRVPASARERTSRTSPTGTCQSKLYTSSRRSDYSSVGQWDAVHRGERLRRFRGASWCGSLSQRR